MPRVDAAPFGAPCWIDLFTSDPERSQDFYGQLFGWTAETGGEEYGGYITFSSRDGQLVAGGMRNDGSSGTPDVWSVYLATPDAQATADAAVAHGGQIHVPVMEVPGQGSMLLLADSGNAAIGAWQPAGHTGFGVLGEPGAPAWFELHTRDYEAAVKFYEAVFAWDAHVLSDAPEFRYTTLGQGEGQLAGVMDAAGFLPEGVGAHWTVYFNVEDTDVALARIVELGGSVVLEAESTPFGRIAEAADSTGARFKLQSAL